VLDPSLEELESGGTEEVRSSFGTWLAAVKTLPDATFEQSNERGSAKRDGVSRVLAGPIDVKGHEKDLAFTMSQTVSSTGEIIEADIIFNTRYRYDDVTGNHCNSYDLASVATHEVGHFFGLADDPDTSATMFKVTEPCDVHKRVLTSVDVDAM